MHSAIRSRDPALPRRRQNKSCDQCRDGKRRCDVQISYQHPAQARATVSAEPSKHTKLSPCSNCTRWKKRCTIEWIKSRERRVSIRPTLQQSRDNAYSVVLDGSVSSTSASSNLWDQDTISFWNGAQAAQSSFPERDFDFPEMTLRSDSSFGSSDSYASCANRPEVLACKTFGLDARLASPLFYGTDARSESRTRDTQGIDVVDIPVDDSDRSDVLEDGDDRSLESMDGYRQPTNHLEGGNEIGQCYSTQRTRSAQVSRAASPFTSQLLAADYNRLSIKKSLLKIYHDSMEGALSCWLTERNCPYSSAAFDGKDVWSSDWANRIVTRVCDLDKAYANTGALSKNDQQQASRVLNLVVMAFAAQWSQTGERANSRLSDPSAGPSSPPRSANQHHSKKDYQSAEQDVFGRDMQKSLWYEANKALCEASDNVSFRVIFAGIMFSLAQRPIDGAEVLRELDTGQQSGLVSLFNILDLDGAPIWLDIALRKLHDHQRTLEDAKHVTADSGLKTRAARHLPAIHKETVGLLCWLAIMFDTLSAAVNRRSFTICDTDSNFNGVEPHAEASEQLDKDLALDLDGWYDFSEAASPYQAPEVDIWGHYFLDQLSRAGDMRKQNIRWPCSFDEAASCLADAAPVKVLLFRRVANLQSLSYRRSSAEQIEMCLEAAMEVYSHWNTTYGRFIQDCIDHHEDLPARIQSWYILLAGHWNLAVLILSDTVEKLDNAQVTRPCSRRSRHSVEFVRTLRTRAAFVVSELGRCSRYGPNDLTFSKSPDFHHAVNKAALLTEPWTMVLVRSFGYAGAFLARHVLSQTQPLLLEDTGGTVEARQRLQYCIDALWLLGKKSDMAMCAAEALQQAVD